MRVVLISALMLFTLIGSAHADDSAFARIIESGSTNSRGYVVSIQDDGGATVMLSGPGMARLASSPAQAGLQNFPAGTIDVKTLQQLLAAIGDVSYIPVGGCAKSVSFGTRTQIEYNGQTSGDLQCILPTAREGRQAMLVQNAQALEKFIQTAEQQLQINIRPVQPLVRPVN